MLPEVHRMMWDVFNLFGKGKKSTTFKPPRAPGETIRPDDAQYLRDWVTGRAYVEGFVEPETMVNEMSVVLVDEKGNYTRRRIGGPKGIDQVADMLGIMLYDVEETGYPDRMRRKIEQERILRKREEQKQRRARFERGENPYG
ncbi:hypothetical protein GCM10022417_14190 [Corynebacterium pilbarense]